MSYARIVDWITTLVCTLTDDQTYWGDSWSAVWREYAFLAHRRRDPHCCCPDCISFYTENL